MLIFGEVTPKSLAKEMPEKVATAVSPFLVLLMALMTPLTWLFTQWKKLLGHFVHSGEADTITEGELMTMVSEAENDGELTDRESELIRSAIEFDDVEVEEILTPRVDVVAVEDDIPLEELAQTFAESGYSRLPVYHGTIDNIIGVVHEKDFYIARLKKATKIDDLVVPTLYTTGSTQISQLLRTLREQHHHMAVVVDEYGGTAGVVCMEDILEEIVGNIMDEYDEDHMQYVASYCCFAPADDPQILGMCVIYNPQGVYYGGTIAAPVIGKIFENILPYLGIEKQ